MDEAKSALWYRDKAAEIIGAAAKIANESIKAQYLDLAAGYHALASELERRR